MSGRSAYGKPLKDGAAALFVDGQLRVAIAEERVSRRKHAAGFGRAAQYCLDAVGAHPRNIDVVAFSSCCDSLHTAHADEVVLRSRYGRADVYRVGHHLSHALSAYDASPWERALVVVADAGGNTARPAQRWWHTSREQCTYWLGEGEALQLVDADFTSPFDAGLGEVYRAATHYLGWPSHTMSNKTMALAGLGDPEALGIPDLIVERDGRLVAALRNRPDAPAEMLGEAHDGSLGRAVAPRGSGDLEPAHRALAALVQRNLEGALRGRIGKLAERLGVNSVCLAGGVAYNCQANSALLADPRVRRSFVPVAPGDTGQAIGNALFAIRQRGLSVDRDSLRSPYLGSAPVQRRPPDGAMRVATGNTPRLAADLVAAGALVATCLGPSEFGARALGNRSILADPRIRGVEAALNTKKAREAFMPFGCSVRRAAVGTYFADTHLSPYMHHVHRANARGRDQLPAVLHVDGTSRVHTVDRQISPWFDQFLVEFAALAGVPAVLNTSFNSGGAPIVETEADAFAELERGLVDVVMVEGAAVVSRPYAAKMSKAQPAA